MLTALQLQQLKRLTAAQVPPSQIAEKLGIARSTIYRWRQHGYQPATPKRRQCFRGRPRLTEAEIGQLLEMIRTETPRSAPYSGEKPPSMNRATWSLPSIRAVLIDRYGHCAECVYSDRVLGRFLHQRLRVVGNWKGIRRYRP